MKWDVAIAGALGVLIGGGIYQLASMVSTRYSGLIEHPLGIAIIFLILLGIAIAEMPVMLFGLKKIAASTTPRPFLLGTHLVFVMFASVYAAIFVLLTGQIIWGWLLALVIVARFFTGALFK
ncbi:MAG: hypothetical protein HZC40_14900 [Chloroflexi bacterium]|nr:hypothetical protein [Chloroflexota bacterium]